MSNAGVPSASETGYPRWRPLKWPKPGAAAPLPVTMSLRSREHVAGATLRKANGASGPRAEEGQGTVFIDSLGITYLDSPQGFQYVCPNVVTKAAVQSQITLIDENGVTTTLASAGHEVEAASTSEAAKSCRAAPDEAECKQCFTCHIIFKSMASKLRHMKRDHPEEYAAHVQRHPLSFQASHEEERLRCPGPSLGHFMCLDCGKTFTNRKALRGHQAKHRQSFPCTTCGRSFDILGNLRKHQLTHSKDDREKAAGPYICKE